MLPRSTNLSTIELGTLASPIVEEKEEVPSTAPEVAPVTPPDSIPALVEISSPVVREKGSTAPCACLS